MIFKENDLSRQFLALPKKLQEISYRFIGISQQLGKEAVVTRIKDPVKGDSGVHEANRAIDFRDETLGSDGTKQFLYDPDDVNYLTSTLNNEYPRNDGKLVCIHHSFNGGMYHFHLQIPESWA